MVFLEFPVRFENPGFSVFGVMLGIVFVFLFYLSRKRLRTAEKSLELVKWQTVRKVVNITNIGTKISMVVALSFLLATPYLSIKVDMPIEKLSDEQRAQSSVTIMLLLDVSYSMNTSDLKPSRLRVAEQMSTLLVSDLGSADLVGFMSFAGEIYDHMPPTLNRSSITETIDKQTVHPSTAIGTGLLAALGVLESSQGGKAIVLFSDGKNNVLMNLTSVGEAAATMKIPIFTVFVGTYGIWEADPVTLEQISNMTGGDFYKVRSEEIKALVAEVSTISREVKVGAMKAVSDRITYESRDYYAPMLFFAALLVISLFLIWFTGV
jgi:Mg-chelatase subunit ChlD